MKVGVLASGRGSNLQALIDAVKTGRLPVKIIGVGSDTADAAALARAANESIPARAFPPALFSSRLDQERSILFWFEELEAELLVLAGYMRLLSEHFIRGAGCPIINIHPALLPSFPGLHAQRQALNAGVRYSGCTVHFVDAGLDTGPIILQQTVPVYEEDTEESLSERILREEHLLLPEAVRLIAAGKVRHNGRKVLIERDA
ncbi:MAG: phosphoribosylglycinamide formyltransferase [Gracilibacteraceae bacterium]|nr:phosphoribosylglycinamide formyltransferase [Gracilibacteraceae bacterium]